MFIQRHDLNRSIADFLEKAVERRSLEQDFPSCSRGLAEHDVRDSLALRKRDEPVPRLVRFHAHNGRAECFSELDIALQGLSIPGVDAARGFPRRLDVHGIPAGSETAGNAGTRANDTRGIQARAHTHHGALRNERRLEAFSLPAGCGLVANLVRDGFELSY